MKNIESIPQDVDELFFKGKEVSEENLKQFLDNIGSLLKERLRPKTDQDRERMNTLRMSKLGLPDRKLWFEYNTPLSRNEPAKNALKFIYGDIVEQLVLFLLKESGHTVEDEQKEVTVEGVLGHQDGKVDGYTADVKSASSFAFRKFISGTLHKDDPFGYVAQLSAYTKGSGNDRAVFIAVNKENGEIAVLKLHDIDIIDPVVRVKEVKNIIALPLPPENKCYEPEPYGTSGNMALHKNCSYCPFKDKCWKDTNNGKGLRKFKYASGIVNMTSVVNVPKVEEIITPSEDTEVLASISSDAGGQE